MNLEMSGEIKIPKPLNFTKQLNQIDRKINKLLDLYMEERLSKDLLNTKLNDLNKKKEVLMKQQEITEVSEVQKLLKTVFLTYLNAIRRRKRKLSIYS